MNKFTFLALVEGMFSVDGALVQAGGRYNERQKEYAMHIANAISRDEAVALCEADTGTGKSIAYLIPSLVHLAVIENSLPIVVSTHTRALQSQLIEKDIVLAGAALAQAGLKLPRIAFRMGRQAFFSPTRVQDAISNLSESVVGSTHNELLRFAQASVITGSGLWMDYINEYGVFPEGISADDICLLDLMQPDNPAYLQHLELAKGAQLLITNHATVLNKAVFKDSVFHALICDEAHEIEEVCKNLATHKSQLKRIASALSATESQSKGTKTGIDLAGKIEEHLKGFDEKNGKSQNLISDINNQLLMTSVQADVVALHKTLASCRSKYVSKLGEAVTVSQARVVDRLDRHIDTLKSFERGAVKSKRRAVAFSPSLRDASVATISLNAGALFNYRATQLTKRTVLVSATMANPDTKTLNFSHLRGALNIKAERVTDECSVSPSCFGKMSFVVVPHGKSPLISNGSDFAFDDAWIKATAAMIDKAALTGKTLVLSPSLKESQVLSSRIKADHLLQDEKNPLMQLTKLFITGGEQVLLSAGAWNGVSFRCENGGQLLKNIVITRIPFLPADHEQMFLQKEWLTAKGFTEAEISRIHWTRQQYQTMVKLKQGIGRGLRSPTDEIKIWFADPRMPTIKNSSGLVAAIPKRFLEDYYHADVFDGEQVKEAKPFYFI